MFSLELKYVRRPWHRFVSSLQQRVAQKEETLRKYEELLRQARDDMATMNQRHEQELRLLQVI